MDTTSLKRYLVPMWRHFARKMRETRGEAGATPLPDTLLTDDAFKDIGTVEKLAENFKAGQARTFIDFLPEEAKSDPSITKYKTGEEMFKGHKSLVEMIGKKGITMPADGASDEEINKFYNSLGRPENAEGYQFVAVENLHPDIKVTPESEKVFKEMLHGIGLNSNQANAINTLYLTKMTEALVKDNQGKEETRKQGITALRNEWGGKYDENVNLAKRLIKVFGGEKTIAAFGDLGNKPEVLKFLSGVGRKLSEDSINNLGGVDLLADAGAAKKKIDEIAKQLMTMKQGDKGYDDLVKERTRLYKVAYPESEKT